MVKTSMYKHISNFEQKEILSELKKHFGNNKFTYQQAKEKLPEINKLRLLSIFRKAKVRGMLSVIGQIKTNVNQNKAYVNEYRITTSNGKGSFKL